MVHGLVALSLLAVVGFSAALYHYKTLAAVKAELAKVEATASADVKALVAKLKAVL